MKFRRTIALSFLLSCLLLSQAQQAGATSTDSGILIADATQLKKILPFCNASNNTIIFCLAEHRVVALKSPESQNIQLIYIIPKDPEDSNCKEKLREAAQDVQLFFLPQQKRPLYTIQADSAYAQINLTSAPSNVTSFIGASTTAVALKLTKDLGAPIGWSDNRPIWGIVCNNKRTRLEIALDLTQSYVTSLDFIVQGADLDEQSIRSTLKNSLKIYLRDSSSSSDEKKWASCTSFPSEQVLGVNIPKTQPYTKSTLFLVKIRKQMRLAAQEVLEKSSRDALTWVQSNQVSYPDHVLILGDLATETGILQTPSKLSTPGIELERYIKSLQSK